MIVALTTPLLIAITGLSVDVGYWFQQQESLQSAADSAALAAALSDSRLNAKTAATKQTAAAPVALAAADSATNSQFNFGAGKAGTSLVLVVPTSSATLTKYVATATIPRASFFSKVGGIGLVGLGAGSQVASATAIVQTTTTGGGCIVTLGQSGTGIYSNGSSSITATNCGIVSDSTAACVDNSSSSNPSSGSIVSDKTASISGSSVTAAGCVISSTTHPSEGLGSVTATSGSGAIGTGSENDPLANIASPPTWPTMPTTPSTPVVATGNPYYDVSNNVNNAYTTSTKTSSGYTFGNCGGGNCNLLPSSPNGLMGLGNYTYNANLVLNSGSSSGTTFIKGGFNLVGGTITLQGSTYNITGGIGLSCQANCGGAVVLNGNNYSVTNTDSPFPATTTGAGWAAYFHQSSVTLGNATTGGSETTNGTYNFTGGIFLSYGTINMAPGTYNITNTAGWAMEVQSPTFNFGVFNANVSVAPESYYFNGGVSIDSSTPTASFGPGTYMFSSYPTGTGYNDNNSGNATLTNINGASGNYGALSDMHGGTLTLAGRTSYTDVSGNIAFTGGTYYFDGGLTISSGTHVTFGPGIYYIRNGNLAFAGASTEIANGATFVLECGSRSCASFQVTGGSASINLSAPTQNAAGTNCDEPIYNASDKNAAIYTESQYTLAPGSTTLNASGTSAAPYDGTDGKGICNILIYQTKDDTVADVLQGAANETITGIIYTPSAALSLGLPGGGGSGSSSAGVNLSSSSATGSSNILAIISNSLSVYGNSHLNVSLPSGSVPGVSASTTTTALLVN